MNGFVTGALVVLLIVVIVGVVFLVNWALTNGRASAREREYRKSMVAIESKKARAITENDLFGQWEADQQAEALRQRYIAGKGPA